MFIPTQRATILVPSGTAAQPDLKHLFILVCDPYGKPQLVIIVSISKVKQNAHYDPTCLLYPGDHEFIKLDSFVAYRTAKIIEVNKILSGIKKGLLTPKAPIDPGIYARIYQGMINSRFTPTDVKIAFKTAHGIP
jgi:hypothetical protein